jgi:hypothetical protein
MAFVLRLPEIEPAAMLALMPVWHHSRTIRHGSGLGLELTLASTLELTLEPAWS